MERLNLAYRSTAGVCVIQVYAFFPISDLKIKIGDKRISAHKFVLAARSDTWSLANLASAEELDLSGQSLLHSMMLQVSLE